MSKIVLIIIIVRRVGVITDLVLELETTASGSLLAIPEENQPWGRSFVIPT